MRLTKLTLNGFKSFADATEFTFDDAITGIVGPNGCGKSNVVDAIKWVLGERSSKSLRGTEMLDCIFAGSSSRKPSGMASVRLSFDNPLLKTANFSGGNQQKIVLAREMERNPDVLIVGQLNHAIVDRVDDRSERLRRNGRGDLAAAHLVQPP